MPSVWSIVASVVGGLIASSAAWFVFARQLITRSEVQVEIDRAVGPLKERQDHHEDVVESLRGEISKLREAVVELTTTLKIMLAK